MALRTTSLLRSRDGDGDEQNATTVELFFDLVFVFAITQLSHHLIDHLDLAGALRTGLLLMVVWWAWISTTWLANWFDTDTTPIRLVLVGVMLASLVMAVALPEAFDDSGLLFAGAFVVLQVGRNVAALLLLRQGEALRATFRRILAWSTLSAPLWIAGGLVSPGARPWVWLAALAVDVAAPLTRYRTPWLGRDTPSDWTIEGSHFAERFQLFIIICLGESIVLTGATAEDAGLSVETVVALGVAFLGTAALWWLYFDEVAVNSKRLMAGHEEAGLLARDGYTYLHIPIVAGIIVAAVAFEVLLAHPGDELKASGIAVFVGGPLLFLAGESGFRWRMARKTSRPRLLAMLAVVLLIAPAVVLPALAVAVLLTAVLIALAAWETVARRPPSTKGRP